MPGPERGFRDHQFQGDIIHFFFFISGCDTPRCAQALRMKKPWSDKMSDFEYSKEVLWAAIKGTRSFTTLLIRVHRDDSRANKATRRFRRAWSAASGGTQSIPLMKAPIGHCASLVIPDCSPDQLELIAKLGDYWGLKDGQYASLPFFINALRLNTLMWQI